MDEGDQNRQLIDGRTKGTGRLRGGVDRAHEGVRAGLGRARAAIEDAGWFLRQHVAWPVEDSLYRLGRRGAIGVFGGGGIAVAGVVLAALVIASPGGSSANAGAPEAFVTPQPNPAPAPATAAPTSKPKSKMKATKPTGPTLHGAPPDFSPAEDVRAGVADGKALDTEGGGDDGEAPARRGAANGNAAGGSNGAATDAAASSDEAPASTAKIGATPAASASAQAQASSLEKASDGDGAETGAGQVNGLGATGNPAGANATADELSGPPAPKAAKTVARRFAEAFVVYEVDGIDAKVREAFGQTSTRQLSRSLLHRPPRQPASVKVPRAKVVSVVAGPSRGKVYTVSVSLLRVGVTSELRLEMEQGVGKKWQVTNVLG